MLSSLPLHSFVSPSRNKTRKGLKLKPKKGKEEGECSLLWAGACQCPFPSAVASLVWGGCRHYASLCLHPFVFFYTQVGDKR